jgi:hypothetical protein
MLSLLKSLFSPAHKSPLSANLDPLYILMNEASQEPGTISRSRKEDVMTTVTYQTENGIFRFTVEEVREHIDPHEPQSDESDVAALLYSLSSASGDSITIPSEPGLFPYIALNLIRDSKGAAYCKICDKTYGPTELKATTVGHGESPLSVKVKMKGGRRKLFGKKERLPLFGGRGYQCPEGHELIAMVTWRT